jgi:hypothetical protein
MLRLDDWDKKKGHGWIGFDLDGTLAYHKGYKGRLHIGEPIPEMIQLVRHLLEKGAEVRIVTARVAPPWWVDDVHVELVHVAIKDWCRKHLGQEVPITCCKDKDMFVLVDDRAIQVQKNTGRMW